MNFASPLPFSTLAVTNEQPLRHITVSRFFKRHTAFSPSLTPLLPPMPVVPYILSTLRRKRESEEEERKSKREEKKKGMVALLLFITAYNGYFGRKKNCWTRKVHLVVTFSKIRLDTYGCHLQYYQVKTVK